MAAQLVRAAGLIVYRQMNSHFEYLLLQHAPSKYSKGLHWTPPKGHVDEGEEELSTAFRETQEESGISHAELDLVEGFQNVVHYEVQGRPKYVRYWLAKVKDAEVKVKLSREHQAHGWFDIEGVKTQIGFNTTVDALIAAENFLKSTHSLNV